MTVAQGLHWLTPFDRFFHEVDRVLKPGGVFAAVSYCVPRLTHERAQAAFSRYYDDVLGSKKLPGELGCHWVTNRPSVDSKYSDVKFPYATVERQEFPDTIHMSLLAFQNLLSTMSAYRSLVAGGSPDPLPTLMQELQSSVGSKDLDGIIEVVVPYFIVSCSKN